MNNTGNQDAVDVDVRDLLPTQIDCATMASAISDGGTCTDGTASAPDQINWTIGSVAVGSSVTLTYVVTIPDDVAPFELLRNTAGVREFDVDTDTGGTFTYVPADNIDPTQTDTNAPAAKDDADVRVQNAGLTKAAAAGSTEPGGVTESGNTATQATVGEWITYTVTATLPKDTTLYTPTLVDTVPAGLAIDTATVLPSATGTAVAGPVTVSGQVVTVPLTSPYLVGGSDEVVTLTFRAQVTDATQNVAGVTRTNSVQLSWTDSEGTPRHPHRRRWVPPSSSPR